MKRGGKNVLRLQRFDGILQKLEVFFCNYFCKCLKFEAFDFFFYFFVNVCFWFFVSSLLFIVFYQHLLVLFVFDLFLFEVVPMLHVEPHEYEDGR